MLKGRIVLFFLVIALFQAVFTGESEPGEVYKYQSFHAIEEYLKNLVKMYPKLARLETAQEKYGLQYHTCDSDKCPIYILTLTEFDTLTADRPQVFFSGAIHGNEVIGTNVVTYFAHYLLKEYGNDKWLTYLLQNRVIVIMPAANAQGYMYEARGETYNEKNYEPNADFPYNNEPTKCMQTLTARSILHVFKNHIFRIGVSFHAGSNFIGYEWGSKNHLTKDGKSEESPDNKAMAQIGGIMKEAAGEIEAHKIKRYVVGRTADLREASNGTMEDWAYAASWTSRLENSASAQKCEASTYGGFDNKNLEIGNHSIRFPLYFVQADYNKHPENETFGREEGIIKRNSPDDGHIPRNIRLALAVTDMAQPYIRDIAFKKQNSSHARISWKVGGALYVNETYVEWDYYNSTYPPSVETANSELSDFFMVYTGNRTFSNRTEKLSGTSVWLNKDAEFEAFLPISANKRRFIIRIYARTDLQWNEQVDPKPNSKPLTHLVRLRVKDNYIVSEKGALIFSQNNGVYSQTLAIVLRKLPPKSGNIPISVFVSIVTVCVGASVLIPLIACLYFRRRYRNYEAMS